MSKKSSTFAAAFAANTLNLQNEIFILTTILQ